SNDLFQQPKKHIPHASVEQTASSPSLTSCFSQAFPKQQSELSSLDSVHDERWKTEQTT
ncbi:hypothetical protein Bpfe_020508, partial [Biomphalaria pfeifferi]